MNVWSYVKTALKVLSLVIGVIFLRNFVKFYDHPMDGPKDVTGFRRIGEASAEALVITFASILSPVLR